MDENSETYKKFVKLDEDGLCNKLKQAYVGTKETEEGQTEMGTALSHVREITSQGISWVSNAIAPPKDEEYEFKSEAPSVPIEDDIGGPESYDVDEVTPDRAIEKDKKMREGMRRICEIMSPKVLPSIVIDIDDSNRDSMALLLNWISETSGHDYTLHSSDHEKMKINKSDYKELTESIISYDVNEPVKHTVTEYEESEAVSAVSARSQGDSISTSVIDSKKVTSSARSLMTLLEKGVILPPRRANKPKKISIGTLNMSENEILSLIINDPLRK